MYVGMLLHFYANLHYLACIFHRPTDELIKASKHVLNLKLNTYVCTRTRSAVTKQCKTHCAGYVPVMQLVYKIMSLLMFQRKLY